MTIRSLHILLGDQLDPTASGLDGFDPQQDRAFMAEVVEESTHVWSSKQRIAVFLSGMRHFAETLRAQGFPLDYWALPETPTADEPRSLAEALTRAIQAHQPQALVMTAPGDHRVLESLKAVAQAHGLPLDIREDRHFYCTVREFAAHAKGRKQLRLEYFYRELRVRHQILLEPDGKTPLGGQWNFDADNRESFGKQGPGLLPAPKRFVPDALTTAVIDLVNRRFADHPGTVSASAEGFGWPVTRAEALEALDDFLAHRLPLFGRYEDAIWAGEPWLYHAQISSAMNLKLLHPREVIAGAVSAYEQGRVPLSGVEGFVRQILGWREYVRGIYWTQMPDYRMRNALGADQDLPDFYWTGETDMACLRDALTQTLATGYAHHIQRLMVIGLYGLLLGVRPQAMHEWFLSVYVDAVEWVELPNTLGMGQFGDGGLMASKPYVASGKYIQRMSNYCAGCRYDPALSEGEKACPFTVQYWGFLDRHEALLSQNPRMAMQLKNLRNRRAAKA